MNTDITIRSGGVDDIATIVSLANQIWPATYSEILSADQIRYMMEMIYSPESLRNQIIEKKHSFIIVKENGSPIGFASYSVTNQPGIYKLHKIYVLQNQQGKGLGKYIIDSITDIIRPKGAVALHLNVNRNNKAKYFYEKLGFRVLKEEDIDIGNNYFMNDYVMELTLRPAII